MNTIFSHHEGVEVTLIELLIIIVTKSAWSAHFLTHAKIFEIPH